MVQWSTVLSSKALEIDCSLFVKTLNTSVLSTTAGIVRSLLGFERGKGEDIDGLAY